MTPPGPGATLGLYSAGLDDDLTVSTLMNLPRNSERFYKAEVRAA